MYVYVCEITFGVIIFTVICCFCLFVFENAKKTKKLFAEEMSNVSDKGVKNVYKNLLLIIECTSFTNGSKDNT